MKTEFEVKFLDINLDSITEKLISVGGVKVTDKTLMKRVVYNKPGELGTYIRVRDEGHKTTLTLKKVSTDKNIDGVKEINLPIGGSGMGGFDEAKEIFEHFGIELSSYQENYREKWTLGDGNIEICIDTWPGLKPFIEIEGSDEESVRSATAALGFEFSKGVFGAVDTIYELRTGMSKSEFNKLKVITFQNNPF